MSGVDACIACQKHLPDDGRFMKCSNCDYCYHLGQNCSGIAPNTFTTMGQGKRDVWVCKPCRANKKRQGSISHRDGETDLERSGPGDDMLSELRTIRKSLETLPALHEKVDSLLLLKGEFSRLSVQVQELEDSVSFVSKKYDTVLAEGSQCRKQTSECVKEVDALKATVVEQAAQIQHLQDEHNDIEQYSRRANLEIHGLPVEEDENLLEKLSHLADKLGVSGFSASDVLAVHRLPNKRDSAPTVLVRFASVRNTETWLDARGKLHMLHQSGALPKLFFNENLTKLNRDLYWQARTAAKEKDYKFCWVKRGKIFAKKHENAPLLRITKVADIARIV